MYRKTAVRILWILAIIFVAMNIVAGLHAYKFTHFSSSDLPRPTASGGLSFEEKLKALFLGIESPRPENVHVPSRQFETVMLQSNKAIECWYIRADNPKGTVIVFHGYGGKKSAMLDKADEFISLGYSALLVDFMGSGGSEGNQSTIGFHEAQQVKTCYDYVASKGEAHIFLFGTSMGAVAILKAVASHNLQPNGIIVECPFGTMYETTRARFRMFGVPAFPMAGLLVFWGGIENDFWAFSHKPVEYAKSVHCPTLLLYGEQDEKVSREEIDEIYLNLTGDKVLRTYPLAGHENFLNKYAGEWRSDVHEFISRTSDATQ